MAHGPGSGLQINPPIQVHRLVVVEWLSDSDQKTGHALVTHLHSRQPGLAVEYVRCNSRQDVFNALEEAGDSIKTKGAPVIHFEAHGYTVGDVALGLKGPGKTGPVEIIEWRELETVLRTINILSEFNLIVVAAACLSESVLFGIKANDIAPFVAAVAFSTFVAWSRLEAAMIAFHEALMIERSGIAQCMDRAQAALGPDERLGVSFLPRILNDVAKDVARKRSTKEAFEELYRRSDLQRRFEGRPPEGRLAALRRLEEVAVSSIERSIGTILAYHLFPQNRERFGVIAERYVRAERKYRLWSV